MPLPSSLITRWPERLSGAAVFAGTRVPVQTLFDYLEGGDSLSAFLDDFPSVIRSTQPAFSGWLARRWRRRPCVYDDPSWDTAPTCAYVLCSVKSSLVRGPVGLAGPAWIESWR
jgi:hypothetical protein